MLFVSSWALDSNMWEYQIPVLVEQGMRCVAFDRRGHGRSDRPSGGYDFDTFADDISALVQHLNLDEITLVGHSMGGAEAVRYLSRHGESRVARLILLAAITPGLAKHTGNPNGIDASTVDAVVSALQSDRPKYFHDRSQAFFATVGNGVSSQLINWTVAQCLSTAPLALVAAWRAQFQDDFHDDCAKINVPTAIIHGAADTNTPAELTGRRTAKVVRNARYIEYPTAGHALFVTHRERLNSDLLTFAKS
jgi:non-heme chloroperoxidase